MHSSQILSNLLKELTILYVEDDSITQDIISEILRDFCWDVKLASNGEEALSIFENENIDLIITDIEMPQMDGIAFIEEVRKSDISTPVVMLSAYTDSRYLFSSINLKVESYVVKPVSYQKIKDALFKVATHLKETKNIYTRISKSLAYDKLNSFLIEGDKKIELQRKERILMDLLVDKKGDLVEYSTIEKALWSDMGEVMTSTALRTVVKKLRKKTNINFIENISSSGYKLKI